MRNNQRNSFIQNSDTQNKNAGAMGDSLLGVAVGVILLLIHIAMNIYHIFNGILIQKPVGLQVKIGGCLLAAWLLIWLAVAAASADPVLLAQGAGWATFITAIVAGIVVRKGKSRHRWLTAAVISNIFFWGACGWILWQAVNYDSTAERLLLVFILVIPCFFLTLAGFVIGMTLGLFPFLRRGYHYLNNLSSSEEEEDDNPAVKSGAELASILGRDGAGRREQKAKK